VRRFCVIITVVTLLSGSAGVAQVNLPGMSAPNTGATLPSDYVGIPSPVGAISTEASIGGAGIPLGTTELFAGGLSPAPTDAMTPDPTCPGASPIPGVGALGTGSIFATNGTMATSASDISSSVDPTDSGCGAAPSAGAGPLGLTSSLGTGLVFTGGNVPLGATALNTTGLGGIIAIPAPGSLSPCTSFSSTSTGSNPGTPSSLTGTSGSLSAPSGLATAGTGLTNAGSIPMQGMSSTASC
jgi:hypothetical protein